MTIYTIMQALPTVGTVLTPQPTMKPIERKTNTNKVSLQIGKDPYHKSY